MFKGKSLVLAAVLVALPLLAFYITDSRLAASSRQIPRRPQPSLVEHSRARMAPQQGSSQVPVTVVDGAGDTAAVPSATAQGVSGDVIVSDAISDSLPPTAEELQNPKRVFDELVSAGTIPAVEAARVERMLQSIVRQMPRKLLIDSPHIAKMLSNYANGASPADNSDAGAVGAVANEAFPTNPYEAMAEGQVAPSGEPSEDEKHQSLNDYLSITSENAPSNSASSQ